MAGDTHNEAGSLREAVIEAIKLGEGAFGKREIARALKLKGTDAKRDLKDALAALEADGAIKRTASKTYALAGALPSVTVVEITDRDNDGELLAEPVRPDRDAPPIRLAPGEGAGGKGEPALGIGDKALVRFGFPVGPITLLDEVGVDVGTKVGPVLEKAFGDRMASPDAAGLMIENDYLGRKSGRGFYIYEGVAKGEKPVNTALYELMNVTSEKDADDEEIVSRCAWLMINEAAYCLQDGIISDPMHGDIGAIFGIGFPPFLGGPFRYMDQLGVAKVVERLKYYADKVDAKFKPAAVLETMAAENTTFY